MDSINTNVTFSTMTSNASSSPPPSGCLVLFYKDFLPWDNPENVISAKAEELVRRWKNSLFLPILFLIGCPANVINMAVFSAQGLKERINVCLFALSLADFLYLLQTFLLNCETIPFDNNISYGPLAMFIINHNLTGFYGFHWVSQVLSAIIATERCFCVLRPLRAHAFLSTSTITAIIVVVKVVIVGPYFLVVSRYRVTCVYDAVQHVSSKAVVPGEFYLAHQKLIDYLDAFIYGAGLPGLMMLVVSVTTVLTMMKLRQAASWRAETSSGGGMSSKEIALTRMLVCNSLLFIVCVFPNVLFRFTWLFLPEMNLGSSQHNLFLVGLWLLDVVSWINSTFNFLIYLAMGSRYRHTLFTLLTRCVPAVAGSKRLAEDKDRGTLPKHEE